MGHNTATGNMFKVLRQSFCCTAMPDVLWSDGGPQFTAKSFQDFLRKWGVTHCTSSPYYPQSNSKIKAIVKSIKEIITASRDTRTLNENRFCRVLLQYQNTLSCRDGISPALKLSLTDQSKTRSPPTAARLLQNGNIVP